MAKRFDFPLLDQAEELARFGGWSEGVYRDLLAHQSGVLSEEEFRRKYSRTVAILQLDMTGMTKSAMRHGPLTSFMRILNVQKVCGPVLREQGATHIRTFADDFTAIFPQPGPALDAALAIHRRMEEFNAALESQALEVRCCIGLGYGEVFRIGVDGAMGDEMNRASKLGEDTAKGGETLLTESFHAQVRHRPDCRFEPRTHEDVPFPFFSVLPR